MDRNSYYYRQVQLLVQLLPLIAEEKCFALKGGTAINLFVRNLPRLSVDIDLVYLPMKARDEALSEIRDALMRISDDIGGAFPETEVIESFKDKTDALRLVVVRDGAQIKIELSPVLRGTVFKPELMEVCKEVENEFGYAEIPVVALPDLYAGKICAALDRQHPRDLFDVMLLLQHEGLTEDIRKALLVYVISHPRPIAELLDPTRNDIRSIYEGEFLNMTEQNVSLEELEDTLDKLVDMIHRKMTDDERRFLLSLKNKSPEWELLGLEGVEDLPAVKWKLINLNKMKPEKHRAAYKKLVEVLQGEEV